MAVLLEPVVEDLPELVDLGDGELALVSSPIHLVQGLAVVPSEEGSQELNDHPEAHLRGVLVHDAPLGRHGARVLELLHQLRLLLDRAELEAQLREELVHLRDRHTAHLGGVVLLEELLELGQLGIIEAGPLAQLDDADGAEVVHQLHEVVKVLRRPIGELRHLVPALVVVHRELVQRDGHSARIEHLLVVLVLLVHVPDQVHLVLSVQPHQPEELPEVECAAAVVVDLRD
mmetsp:Transcript_66798/g.196053  ORF Transcript_66798/g.196053 Transcript_66798/m.196053 type:complete len:231 (-) Transcript_66798:1701-2393(-)